MSEVLSALIPPGVVAAIVIYAVVKLVRAEGPARRRESEHGAKSAEGSGS